MPEKLKRELTRKAKQMVKSGKLKPRKGETADDAVNRYVYGTLNKVKKQEVA